MQGNSRIVTSNQQGLHPDLDDVVRRHLSHRYQRPFKPVSLAVFEGIQKTVEQHGGPVIFDSGCGTGESSLLLAEQHPEAIVVGFDKSEMRIDKSETQREQSDNAICVRADCIDIWRLANRADWRLQHHFLLYPNPWPKKRHLQRRWHAHPVFKDLLDLGGTLHLRSNWQIYVDEFERAVTMATGKDGVRRQVEDEIAVSAFEMKYRASGQALLEYLVEL